MHERTWHVWLNVLNCDFNMYILMLTYDELLIYRSVYQLYKHGLEISFWAQILWGFMAVYAQKYGFRATGFDLWSNLSNLGDKFQEFWTWDTVLNKKS